MKKLLTYFSFVFLLAEVSFAQQDPQYSQYMFNQLVINPAYCGSKEALNANVDLRKQWVSMPGSPRTATISLHGPLPFKSLGLGGHLINEEIGPSKWTAAYADVAYRFKLGKGKLSFGISAGVVNYNMSLGASDYKDAGEAFVNQSLGAKTSLDAGTGFYYFTNSFYAGGSITHINSPKLYDHVSYYTSPTGKDTSYLNFSLHSHSFLYVGKGFLINQNLIINPSIMYKTDNVRIGTLDLNCNFLIKQKFWLGLSYRSGYGIVALFQYYVNDKFRVGYSFDQGFNRIGVVGQSSHEIMLGYNFNIYKSKMVSPRFL